jgi:hypothetical protein
LWIYGWEETGEGGCLKYMAQFCHQRLYSIPPPPPKLQEREKTTFLPSLPFTSTPCLSQSRFSFLFFPLYLIFLQCTALEAVFHAPRTFHQPAHQVYLQYRGTAGQHSHHTVRQLTSQPTRYTNSTEVQRGSTLSTSSPASPPGIPIVQRYSRAAQLSHCPPAHQPTHQVYL